MCRGRCRDSDRFDEFQRKVVSVTTKLLSVITRPGSRDLAGLSEDNKRVIYNAALFEAIMAVNMPKAILQSPGKDALMGQYKRFGERLAKKQLAICDALQKWDP